MRSRVLAARESFWFLPAVFGVAAILLAQGLVVLDHRFAATISEVSVFDQLSAAGGRSILTTIGTSMLTVAGTSFSITISVLATTSSTYGPRLVRNFLADRSNQLVLAMFTATFLFCLVVVRAVRTTIEDRVAFVPTLGIHVAVVLAVIDVGVLVYFIHHIATSVQITTLQKRVQTDLLRAVDAVRPATLADGWSRGPVPRPSSPAPVPAPKDGYVQQVDLDRLLRAAVRHDLVLEVVAMPGDHVIDGDPVVLASGPGLGTDGAVPPAAVSAVREACVIGIARTPVQDVRFALQQLIEVAVRGLASGTNDPYTPVTALEMSQAALVPLVRRDASPSARLDGEGVPRVLFAWPTVETLLDDVFDTVRQYGAEHAGVVLAALGLAERLWSEARSPAVRDGLLTQVHELLQAYDASGPGAPDRTAMTERGRRLVARMAAAAA